MYNLCKNALNIVNGSLLKADTIERKKGNILKKHSSLQNCYPIENQKFDLPLPILSAPSPEIKSMDKKSAAKLVELAKKNFSAHKESRDNKLKIRTSSKEINFHQSEKNQKTAFWDIPDDATN
ncbi:hypothetical protein HZS_5191 [Henneguya salminicola]|nr:hypothetical protein HZS_5191 [Henneguya salminicola]